jgi:hypothetical protein
MNRSTLLVVIAVGLAAYGLYAASFVPAMIVAPVAPLLLIGFLLQAACALAAAFAVWRGLRWAALAVVLLGASIAATWLVEAFVLGIVAYLRALAVTVVAIVSALIIAAYLNRRGILER